MDAHVKNKFTPTCTEYIIKTFARARRVASIQATQDLICSPFCGLTYILKYVSKQYDGQAIKSALHANRPQGLAVIEPLGKESCDG